MKTPTETLHGIPARTGFRILTTMIAMFSAVAIRSSSAETLNRETVSLSGMYQIASSNDPLFPMDRRQEWFLDFGKGIHAGITSGKVAVSLRENPNVSIRIMVWQHFPDEKALLIGEQTAEGSGRAVSRGVWTFVNDSGAIFLTRERRTVVLKRADPGDY